MRGLPSGTSPGTQSEADLLELACNEQELVLWVYLGLLTFNPKPYIGIWALHGLLDIDAVFSCRLGPA